MECHCLLVRDESQNRLGQHSFSGSYAGAINEYPARFVLHVSNNSLYGKAESAGYTYLLMGHISGKHAHGRLLQHQLGSLLDFQARVDADDRRLYITVSTAVPATTLPLPFGTEVQHDDRDNMALDLLERDRQLIGMWARQDINHNNIEASVFMELKQDGTYRHGHARTLPSNAHPWSWNWDSESVSGGKWQTKDNRLYLTRGKGSFWIANAHYEVDEGKLLLRFVDGAQQQWYRRRRTQVLSQQLDPTQIAKR